MLFLGNREKQPKMSDKPEIDHERFDRLGVSIASVNRNLRIELQARQYRTATTPSPCHTPPSRPSHCSTASRRSTPARCDAREFPGLPGATFGLRPLWPCPPIVGRASTVQLDPKTDHAPPPGGRARTDGRPLLVTAGNLDGISCRGDIIAHAAQVGRIRGSVLGCRTLRRRAS
ncbi:hypothetical protein G3N57_29160 [Paraburkholderia sp. Se-20369]|nr:hypothetical protein [Paraburkholderia sp. Se-20369]